MSEFKTEWRKDEFEAYLLFYCANADFVETEEEKKFIHDRVSENVYSKIHLEFTKDNDYQRIQKIIHSAERLELTKAEIEILFKEIEAIFKTDGHYDLIEKEIFKGLKRVLK